jgi:tetratricopeptide (TPR) repeat protein
MQIIHKIDDFLLELFPKYEKSNNDLEVLKDEITKYYTYGPYKPTVNFDGEFVIIHIDTPSILNQNEEYRKVVSLCERGKYDEAKIILKPLIQKNPTNSEYHRILGQVFSDQGDQEEAINSLIDALRWDPKNGYALTMMGNIFAKHKNDIDTAMKYYDQALKINPEDHIATNNIGANLLMLDKTKESIEYLEKAYELNKDYPNTSYGLHLAYESLGYPLVAFDYAIKCMKASKNSSEGMYRAAYESATKLATELTQDGKGENVFEQFKTYLEKRTGIKIRVEQDTSISTAAKIELAENYDREYHLIKYFPGFPGVEHLKMHELVHLEFATEAREEHVNMLFISGKEMKQKFIVDNEKELKRLSREGYSDQVISNFLVALYEGINRQIFNAPVDLFIEDYLFENFPELQPYQFLSLQRLVREGLAAVTDKKAIKLTPQHVLSASKVLNVIGAIQFKDLYGIDILKQYNALPFEMKEAERMWAEYLEYRKDRKPGEEYEVVKHWGEDLRMEKYFELVDEEDFRGRPKTIEEVMESMKNDPYGLDVDKNFKEKETKDFLESQESIGTNLAVMWFMVDALQFFEKMPKDKIKAIAFEIAMIGTQGINPAPGHTYKVNAIPGKDFSGYHLLGYYYVSWSLAIPDMVDQLNLPYKQEYSLALTTFEAKK